MSFELFVPTLRIDGLKPGEAALDANGNVRFHASDLAQAGISQHAAILIDTGTHRIAVRKPGEQEAAAKVGWNKSRSAGSLRLAKAIAAMGLSAKACKGRLELMRKENMLIVQLSTPAEAPGKRKREGA